MSSAPFFTTQAPPSTPPAKRLSGSPSPFSCNLQQPDRLALLIDKSRTISQLLQIHAVIIRHGHENHPILNFKLQKSYSSLGRLDHSIALFSHIDSPNVFFYTAIIHGHAVHGLHRQAVHLYANMLENGVQPNAFTFSSLSKSCSLEPGMVLHSQAIRFGFGEDLYVRTGLLEVYARGGDVRSARKLFDTMPERSLVSWTAMLTCYAKHGDLDDACALFDEMTDKDVVCWNVMIDGFTQHGRPNKSLGLFRQMLEAGVMPNEVTVLSVLSACGQIGALELGRWLHSYLVNNGIQINVHLSTALVDMYSKCGSLEDARLVFQNINAKDVVAWNSMIVGYAMHGFSKGALQLFDEMRNRGIHPTDITFIGVLNACANAGLVTEGREYFNLMSDLYNIEPKIEHYGCMVNLLGRAGHLQEAYALVKNMAIAPDPVLWGTLLGACKLHGNITLGEEIAEFLVSKNLANSGTYVLLSNMYAAAGNWDGVAKVRSMMKGSGIQKEPGCSSIEVDNKVYEFLAGDSSNPKSGEIYRMLEEINRWLKAHGYAPQREIVLHDIGEREKEQSLEVHSEKLAIAFGLISTRPGATIKIVKNLRVCSDCHEATKLISRITGRRIIVRDRNRFHHFMNGSCSCGDYW
ncbi:hypothetical protein Nepgr_016659 [Nepenthes gracilis]|uniref:DYW domain-containing protein n=1 Tax=Nepenthes gracilis TaxID=150966 RepID=A0AAD3XRT6_NEPGR|nr:hypothetical protein Nepgr_016659 [Nepenthes gracilis]